MFPFTGKSGIPFIRETAIFTEVVTARSSRTGGGPILRLLFYLPVLWVALMVAQSLGGNLGELLENLSSAVEHPLRIHWTERSPMCVLLFTAAYVMGLCMLSANQSSTRKGEEHGSAQWGTPGEVNAMFAQKQNKLLTRNVRLGLDTHIHRRSLNVLVIGGSGAAKTRSFVVPNILEANTNYVITDPKMEVLIKTGGWLKRNGYDIRVLNLVNLTESDGYNPFRYIRDEKDALRLVNNLIQSTTPKNSQSSDPFWGATRSQTATISQGKKTLRAYVHIVIKTAGLSLMRKSQLITRGVE